MSHKLKEYDAKLSKLVRDTYFKTPAANFSTEEGDEVIRKLFTDAMGGKWSRKNFLDNERAVFEVIEMVIDMTIGEYLTNQFNGLTQTYHVPLLSTVAYTYQDPTLFRVSRIAAGTNDLRRQRRLNARFEIVTEWFGTSIYTEFDQFIAGQIDFTAWMNTITRSIENHIGIKIYEAIHGAYDFLNAAFRHAGAYDEEALVEIVDHLRAASGREVVIYGTPAALRKVTKTMDIQWTSEVVINSFHANGFVATNGGLNFAPLPQMHKPIVSTHGVPEFQVDNNMLLILPAGERPIHIVREGDTEVVSVDNAAIRNDRQLEFTVMQKMGIHVAQMSLFGMFMMV